MAKMAKHTPGPWDVTAVSRETGNVSVGQRDLRQAVAWRCQFNGAFASAGVIQQRFLRRQGHALACSGLGQLTGGFGQSFGVVAVHGRSGREHRRDVD